MPDWFAQAQSLFLLLPPALLFPLLARIAEWEPDPRGGRRPRRQLLQVEARRVLFQLQGVVDLLHVADRQRPIVVAEKYAEQREAAILHGNHQPVYRIAGRVDRDDT